MAETGALRQAKLWNGARGMARLMVLAGAVLLSACQTMIPRGKGPEVTGPAKPPVVQPGLPSDSERHRVALLVPLTGANSGVGQSIANATTLALLDTKATNVRITTYDTGRGIANAVTSAINDGNKLILGPLTAEDANAAAAPARRAGVPIVSFSNDTGVAGNGVFIMGYTPAQSVERVVDYARGKGITKFAALVPGGAYGERTGNALLATVRQGGGTVVAMQNYDRSPGAITAAIRKLGPPANYEAVLIADGGRVAMQAAPILRKSGAATARILGTELWNTENALATSPALRGAWFASVSDAYYRQLATKYRARFNAAPYRLAAMGYDAVLLTVRIAQDWRPGSAFPISRLTDKGGFAGIDGAFRFGSDGVAQRALEVQQVDASGFSVIDAAPRGFGE